MWMGASDCEVGIVASALSRADRLPTLPGPELTGLAL